MSNKIALLNLHSSNQNYGAVLQAAALQEFLKVAGYKPVNIKLLQVETRSSLRIFLSKLKFKINQTLNPIKFFTVGNDQIFEDFRKEWITETDVTYSAKNISSISSDSEFLFYIVGSDQVWRLNYVAENVKNYFFDFVNNNDAKKIAYAASFGMDSWEGSKNKNLTLDIKALLNDFHAVSVREDSGVDICRETFQCQSTHVLDPTLLVGRDYFEKVIKESDVPSQSNKIVYYKLDPDEDFMHCLKMLSDELNSPFENIYFKEEEKGKSIRRSYNSVPVWLAKLRDASLIVTDSYHCVCFALLFNKPFIHFNNPSRGNARLESLFRLLSIDSKDVTIESSLDIKNKKHKYFSNFADINSKLEQLRADSAEFLYSSLKG